MGIEESGGLSIFGHVPEKDGILACLLVVEILAHTGKTIKELKADLAEKYGSICSERLDIKTTIQDQERVLNNLKEFQPRMLAGVKVDCISEIEGKKLILEDGNWVLIRASGTEPLFRIYVETDSAERLHELQKEVINKLEL